MVKAETKGSSTIVTFDGELYEEIKEEVITILASFRERISEDYGGKEKEYMRLLLEESFELEGFTGEELKEAV